MKLTGKHERRELKEANSERKNASFFAERLFDGGNVVE